jgi:anhydro-N-acetylmuramic acid kinase
MVAMYEQSKGHIGFNGSLEDELATACLVTAQTIGYSLDMGKTAWWRNEVHEVIVSGGGVENQCLMQFIREAIAAKNIPLVVMDSALTHAKEALAFALLAAATLDGVPSNVPSVTGAKRAVVLGSVTPRP